MNQARAAVATAVSLVTALFLSACGSVTSRTSIDPGQAFRLGGGQPGAFTVRGINSGAAPVVVFVDRDGVRDSLQTIAPGQKVAATFPAGAMAVFVNRSATQGASLSVKITGNASSLGMGYETNSRK